MTANVAWLGPASDRVQGELIPRLKRELRAVFPEATGVTVYDAFGGYSSNQEEKVVLGVEVRSRNAYRTHVVKIGSRNKVANDYDGWRKCVLEHNFASRIFVALSRVDLPQDRAAIVYQDAFRLFGSLDHAEGPEPLEKVVYAAICGNAPNAESVERVIRQIYTELHRWFYRSAKPDQIAATRFYRRRLNGAIGEWDTQNWRRDLRRDVLWLLCGHDVPDAFQDVPYLDPVEYVTWALGNGRFPQTLVGRSHGDLHARNILVGVQRGEAEYPAVFDYGEMDNHNVIAWDFVKLECELKVRLLLNLYEDVDARNTLFHLAGDVLPAVTIHPGAEPAARSDRRVLRADQLAFAVLFETVLNDMTSRINRLADPGVPDPPGGRCITGEGKLDRAMAIILRIRQEAALLLGDGQPQRGTRRLWSDEYYFGLAVYGLASAKFDYRESEAAFALVSAGIAVSRIEMANHDIERMIHAKSMPKSTGGLPAAPYPSYRVPLAHARRAWKGARTEPEMRRALRILERAAPHYPHSVPLLQEYVLLLAENGRCEVALKLLAPFEDLCRVFHDEETLCRVGRMCKDLGDRAIIEDPVAFSEASGHAALQWYSASLRRYRDAFNIGDDYYPGVNAATMALCAGQRQEAGELAERVLVACMQIDLSTRHIEDCFWVLVSQAEAALVVGKVKMAVRGYRQALGLLSKQHRQMVQTAYNQVCRLNWALGSATGDVMAVFKDANFTLKAFALLKAVQSAERTPRTG